MCIFFSGCGSSVRDTNAEKEEKHGVEVTSYPVEEIMSMIHINPQQNVVFCEDIPDEYFQIEDGYSKAKGLKVVYQDKEYLI